MTQQEAWMIALLLGIFALGPLYEYSIGKIGMRHSWSLRKINIVAAGPLLAAGLIAVAANLAFRVFYERPGPWSLWTRFPCTVLVVSGLFVMFASAKGAGVAWIDFKTRLGRVHTIKTIGW